MRLDKYLAHTLTMSRKQVKQIIRNKEVQVNDLIIKDESFHVKEGIDKITWQDEEIIYQKFVYYMLNKPKGVVSATRDNVYPTVLSILDDNRDDLFPIGRLDVDTTGLLIISNDGTLAHQLLSPKYHVDKTYEVKLKKTYNGSFTPCLESGIQLDDMLCKGAKVEVIEPSLIHLSIQEGKFHQVKRMMLAIENEVDELKRIQFGNISLDPTLSEGEYRELTSEELTSLQEKIR